MGVLGYCIYINLQAKVNFGFQTLIDIQPLHIKNIIKSHDNSGQNIFTCR